MMKIDDKTQLFSRSAGDSLMCTKFSEYMDGSCWLLSFEL